MKHGGFKACATVFLLASLLVLALQWGAGAYANSFGGNPDEAAHFVSSVLVRDFLGALGQGHPGEFARRFYVFYPKVGIGNWPPLLYAALGCWFLVFGASKASALVFTALVAAATATVIYRCGARLMSGGAGLFAAALFLLLPLTQESSDRVMTEHLVTLFILLSVLQYARFAASRTLRDALGFGALATVALLTRGSAWALLFVPPLAMAFSRDVRLLLNWRLWTSAVLVLFLAVPWYVLTRGMSNGAMVGTGGAPHAFFVAAIVKFPWFVWRAAGTIATLLALLGAWRVLIADRTQPAQPAWAALIAGLLGVLLIQCIVPASIETRFMVQLLPYFCLFCAAGVRVLLQCLPARMMAAPSPFLNAGLWVLAGPIVMAPVFEIPRSVGNGGYQQIAAALAPELQAARHPAVLMVSDSIGEGSMVAEIALRDPRPHTLVLRGSKILVDEDWLGRSSRERFGTPDALRSLLDSIPVGVVIVDTAINPDQARPYHRQVAELMEAEAAQWRLQARFDTIRYGHATPGAVSVYVRVPPPGSASLPEADPEKVASLMAPGARH